MSIKPIKKVNVSEQVFEQMKGLLTKGEWKPGEKLPSENELAEKFGVSRITIRQALQKLNVLGLLETRLGEGSFVREIEPGDSMNALLPAVLFNRDMLMQVEEFREIVEVESVKLAAERASAEDIASLRQILQRMEKCQGNPKKFGAADLEFHMKLGEMTQNDLVVKTEGILQSTLQEAMEDIVEGVGYAPGIHYHGQLIEAMEQHDGRRAASIMKEHLSNNKNFIIKEEEIKDGL
ncbi:MAG: FadR family transcriptional regulator [Lachnospiraceae bacterium]|nr:FadR family transcriptional regulator [Lachnospiraceae bacterium]